MTARLSSSVLTFAFLLLTVLDQLHVEDELFAGERVVAVDGDVRVRDFGDDDLYLAAVLKWEAEAHVDLRLDGELRGLARDLRDELFAARAVGVLGLYLDGLRLADLHASHALVEAGYDLARADRELQRLAVPRRVEDLPVCEFARVVYAHVVAVFRLLCHNLPPARLFGEASHITSANASRTRPGRLQRTF